MQFLIFTTDYPWDYEGPIPDGDWSLAKLTDDSNIETTVKIEKILYDEDGFLEIGEVEDIYDDSITDNVYQVMKFVFERVFRGK